MKHLLTVIACFFALSLSAQTWNPDADFDNVIGVNDLMELLSVFGTEWTAEYPQDPAYELAAYSVGCVDYFECVRTCTNNNAKIIGLHEYAMFEDSLSIEGCLLNGGFRWWLDDRVYSLWSLYAATNGLYYYYGSNTTTSSSGNRDFNAEQICVCTGLVPVVE
jgi:hypothetical protein